jgi:trigger factor
MEIHADLEDVSSVKKVLKVEISATETSSRFQSVAEEYRRHARVPGFRPGKAPLGLIKRRYAADIRSDVVGKLVPESFQEALKERKISILGEPRLEKVEAAEGQPLVYEAHFEVRPEIELPEYRGLEIEVSERKVTDEDVSEQLEKLREQQATLVSIEDRPIEIGDVAIVDLKGEYADEAEGKPAGTAIEQEDVMVRVENEGTHPTFRENLIGMNIGEEKTFDVEYEEDYPEEKLAGRKVRFAVHVTDIKTRELPELNDEFAKDLGNFESLDDIRGRIQQDLEHSREHERDAEIRGALHEKLLENVSFEVPSVLVRNRLREKLENVAREVAARGVDPARANINWKELRGEMEPEAEKEVRIGLILDRIAEVEGLGISDDEFEQEIDQMAGRLNQPREKVAQYFEDPENRAALQHDLLRSRVMELIIQSATIS